MISPHTLRCELWLPLSPDRVFAFFSDAYNLPRITPPWLNFHVLTPPPIHLKPGTRIDYTIRWAGVPIRWRTRIARFNPPYCFVDTQESGPYVLWWHLHRFIPENGGTRITDTVRYRLPFGPLGKLTHRLMVRKQLEEIFAFRQRTIRDILMSE